MRCTVRAFIEVWRGGAPATYRRNRNFNNYYDATDVKCCHRHWTWLCALSDLFTGAKACKRCASDYVRAVRVIPFIFCVYCVNEASISLEDFFLVGFLFAQYKKCKKVELEE